MSQNANQPALAPKPNQADWIRVSCAALCRIKHLDRYLLLLNANRREKGLYYLSPVGGALTIDDLATFERWSAIPENPAERDLRFLLPVAHLDEFRQWFKAGVERERSPFRELDEELVQESKLLPALSQEAVHCQFTRLHEEESLTQRAGQTGLLTHYLQELYDVTFTGWKELGVLLSVPPESGALWVTEEQIRGEAVFPLTIDGAERQVHVHAKLLLPG